MSLQEEIESYCDEHWDEVLADLRTLVRIESTEDLAAAQPGAPYGPGPKAALDEALRIAADYGFDVHDCEGCIGYVDLVGARDAQIGIIGHVDVVPAGPGWNFEPYDVTEKDGYLLGRGVLDDKGPLVVALHALRFWKDRKAPQNWNADQGDQANVALDEDWKEIAPAQGQEDVACASSQLPYTVRVLIGANEETGMDDVAYYREHFPDPAFLFSPDGQFPLCYGEAGICSGTLASAPIEDGQIVSLQGGQAVNAVAGIATAVVKGSTADFEAPESDDLEVSEVEEGLVRITAHGVSAHASLPEQGVDAIGILVDFLLLSGIGTQEERDFLQLLAQIHADNDGAAFGLQVEDDHFGSLCMVGGVLALEHDRMVQSLDFRYPTTITSQEIVDRVRDRAREVGATFLLENDKIPFLMDPDSAPVRALLKAYNQVTGQQTDGVTSKGGTYARCFTSGVCFGPEKVWEERPDWVGSMHGADEGVCEADLKEAFIIYALAIGNLMECDLQ